ncbi:nucleotidyltransferase and HEPN domain-containing protein [Sphingomonas sp.]|jgi:predicted nucleotidyltransferase/HEPN domain-containing protein|uniref:nucleotidyltransferase and HEPN domain-containing protein n=1 Tax=Sphingomonas sp. TaxID=28214 RepID=UPI002E1091B4|nr:nucleotidyltransferase and HEPN domain-containing protein [Sphingomonas sp.]
MRTSLDHLPSTKQRELERIVQILFAEFEDATALATQKWKKQGRILKVILYGSYARGDWVEDPVGGYYSDYDILVVVSDDRLTDPVEYWAKADDHFVREVTISKRISAPVAFIVHSLAEVNDQLMRGRPFFIDAIQQGIVLYEADGHPFATPQPLTEETARAEARKYFDEWFPAAQKRFDIAKFDIEKGYLKDAAFDLHQTAERFYHCALLTLTLYSPKSHKLNFLRAQAEPLVHELIAVWPRDTKFARRCFELLQQAYVNARYSPHYKITPEELAWLVERIDVLQNVVRDVCERRLAPRD